MTSHPEPQTLGADFQLPGACIGCNGPLAVRVTASGAYGCCLRCRIFANLRLEQKGSELRIAHAGAASA